MTKIRILSGQHAGALLEWTHPVLKVGSSEDLDVYIGDWDAQALELRQDGAGACEAAWQAVDGAVPVDGARLDGALWRRPLERWVPVRFGAIVLCIGPADEAWPDDVELLQRLFAPPPAADPVRPPRRRPLVMLSLAVVVGAGSLAAVVAARAPAAAPAVVPTPPAPRVLVATQLGPRYAPLLDVMAEGQATVVRGVLDSRGDVAEVNRLLDAVPPHVQLRRRFMAAPEVTDLVLESIAGNAIAVRRTGPRDFEISGISPDATKAHHAVERLAIDLDRVGVRLSDSVEQLSKTSAAISGRLVDEQGVSFARARDGVRHIVVAEAAQGPGLSRASARQASAAARSVIPSNNRKEIAP